MNIDKIDVNIGLGIIGGLIGVLIGDLNGALIALIVFMVIDYITGVLAAIVRHAVNSEIGAVGIIKKACMLLVVIIGNIIDVFVLKTEGVCKNIVIFFYLSNEGISICENYAKLGLPFPEKLKKILVQLTNDEKEL